MAGLIELEPSELKACASRISQLNEELENVLSTSKSLMNDLSQSYQGEDATAIISAYNGFAEKYMKDYKQLIQQYVDFLNNDAKKTEDTIKKNSALKSRFE